MCQRHFIADRTKKKRWRYNAYANTKIVKIPFTRDRTTAGYYVASYVMRTWAEQKSA